LASGSSEKPWFLTDETGARSVVFRAIIFREYHKDITNILGERAADEILYRLGLKLGKTARRLYFNLNRTETEFWTDLTAKFQARGWGNVVSHTHVGNVAEIVVEDSALAEEGVAGNACHLLRGLFAGWLSVFGKVTEAKELQCKSQGYRLCRFQFTINNAEKHDYGLMPWTQSPTITYLPPLSLRSE